MKTLIAIIENQLGTQIFINLVLVFYLLTEYIVIFISKWLTDVLLGY